MNDSRFPTTIDINQLISWDNSKELVLKPVYQRNKVWNDSARSYLIDSIMRNYPVPPIFMRDKLNLNERKTIREVVDGQQRISTILDFYNDKFCIKKSHNKELGGKCFNNFSEEEKERFLTYKIIIEKITEKDDSLVFDMFARLNSNSMPLNKQELRNARYTGEFKVAAYEIALSYRDMFANYGIFTTSQLSRMMDVEFISTLMLEYDLGIVDISSTVIDRYYQTNNDNYHLRNEVYEYMYYILDKLNKILPLIQNRKSKFFSSVYLYDLINILKFYKENNVAFNENEIAEKINLLDSEYDNLEMYESTDSFVLKLNKYKDEHQRHSTDKPNKQNRIQFLKDWMDGCR